MYMCVTPLFLHICSVFSLLYFFPSLPASLLSNALPVSLHLCTANVCCESECQRRTWEITWQDVLAEGWSGTISSPDRALAILDARCHSVKPQGPGGGGGGGHWFDFFWFHPACPQTTKKERKRKKIHTIGDCFCVFSARGNYGGPEVQIITKRKNILTQHT